MDNERKKTPENRRSERQYFIRKRKVERLIRLYFSFFAVFFCAMLIRGIAVRKYRTELSAKDSSSAADDRETAAGITGISAGVSPPPSAPPRVITVSVIGDCTLGTDEYFDYESSLNHYYEMYGADYFMENVKDIFGADDLTIANFEGTLTYSEDREDKQFAFKADPELASILTKGNIESANTANNHSHDYGEVSYQDTLAALDREGIVHFGYDETAVMDVEGVKVGLIGIYELDDHMEVAGLLKQNMEKVKQEGSEVTIVIFHWGNELEEEPDENQRALGHMAVDLGADLVCGHHPHVLQGIEVYKDVAIAYSLGNFCFGGNTYPSDFDTIIFQETFTVTSEGVQHDHETNIIPCNVSSQYDYNDYQPTPVSGEDAERIYEKMEERSSYI